MKLFFKILFVPLFLIWPLATMTGTTIPEDLKVRLNDANGEEKLRVWKQWYTPYFYQKPKLWQNNLDAACADAQQILSKEDAAKWCMELHLKLSKKYLLIGSPIRSTEVLKKAKALIEKEAELLSLKQELLKSWLIAKGTHQFLKYEKVDSSKVFFDQALAIDAGTEEVRLNGQLYKAGLEMHLAAGNYQDAQNFVEKIKMSEWPLSASEQLEIDFLALSVKNNRGLAGPSVADYESLLTRSIPRDSVLELKIKLDYAAHLYFNNQYKKAESLLLEIDEVLKQFNIFLLREAHLKTYARVLNKLGRYKDSRAQIKRYREALLDEANRETNQIIKEQKATFKTAQKKEQILKAKREKELRQASYIKKMAYLIGIGTFPIGLLLFIFIKNKNKRKELALISARNNAINNDRNRLFSSITADIKRPLAKMMAPMDRAAMSIKNEEAIADIQLAQRNGQRLMELFDQIHDWNNLEARVLSINLDTVRLVEKLNDLTQRFSAQAKAKGLLFKASFQIEDSSYEVDFEKVNRILANLLSNAVKFCEAPQEIQFIVEEIDNAGGLKFTVRDNGPGISVEDQMRLFDHHFQGQQGQIKGGTGIGLATVKEMVELMKGKIYFDSTIRQGSAFYVELPTQKVRPTIAATQSIHPASDRAIILLIEDDTELLVFLKSELSKNYQILIANNSKDGWALAEQHIPDLIVSDWNLPDQNGGWLCQQLLQNKLTNHIPVMILTGLSNPDHLQQVFDSGAIARMEKPFQLDAFQLQVKNILLQQAKIKSQWSPNKASPIATTDPRLSFSTQVQQIITENLSNEYFSVEKMAELLMISRVQLFRKLKNTTGKSPSELLKEARLEKSRTLLQNTDQSIAEIAYSVGYSDPNNFSTAYKKYFKVNPSTERNS